MRPALAIILDIVVVTIFTLVAFVIVTGGGIYEFGGLHVSVRSVGNPLLILLLLLSARYALRNVIPFLGIGSLTYETLCDYSRSLCMSLQESWWTATPKRSARLLLTIGLASVSLKLLLAWGHPGFFSGDDLEIHEMTFRALFGYDWPIWSLRNALFPMIFVYPPQLGAVTAGLSDVDVLVWIGRASVGVFSTITLWLTWRAGHALMPDTPGFAVFATALVAVNKLHVAFGSSELPRSVATVFVVGAFLTLLKPGRHKAALAGAMLGFASAFRYSEAIFFLSGGVQLGIQKKWGDLVSFLVAGVSAGAIVIGLADAWYWGSPFFSLYQAFDYTLVQGLSSRGYQGPVWYLLNVPEWSTWPVFLISLLGVQRPFHILSLWAFLPIVVLSLLPHKEARYLIPAVPFICLLASSGVRIVLTQSSFRERRSVGLGAVLALSFSLLHDAGGWRLRRSDADVRLLRTHVLPKSLPDATIAAHQPWRIGGHLYLNGHELMDLGAC